MLFAAIATNWIGKIRPLPFSVGTDCIGDSEWTNVPLSPQEREMQWVARLFLPGNLYVEINWSAAAAAIANTSQDLFKIMKREEIIWHIFFKFITNETYFLIVGKAHCLQKVEGHQRDIPECQ